MIAKKYLVMCMVALCFVGCSSDDDSSDVGSQIIAGLTNVVVSGDWIVSSYVDSGTDETNHFSGYTFDFNSNGSVVATNGTTEVNGTWSITLDDDSNDDNPSSSSEDVDFNLSFSSPATFADLTEDWHILEYSSTLIKLQHVSGGNGGTDYLTFTR